MKAIKISEGETATSVRPILTQAIKISEGETATSVRPVLTQANVQLQAPGDLPWGKKLLVPTEKEEGGSLETA